MLESKGSSGFGSSDDAVFIPLDAGYNKLFGSTATYNDRKIVNSISVSVSTTEAMDTVSAQIEFLIRRSHNLTSSDELDFNVLSQSDLLSTLTSVTQTLTVFLGAIAEAHYGAIPADIVTEVKKILPTEFKTIIDEFYLKVVK